MTNLAFLEFSNSINSFKSFCSFIQPVLVARDQLQQDIQPLLRSEGKIVILIGLIACLVRTKLANDLLHDPHQYILPRPLPRVPPRTLIPAILYPTCMVSPPACTQLGRSTAGT